MRKEFSKYESPLINVIVLHQDILTTSDGQNDGIEDDIYEGGD